MYKHIHFYKSVGQICLINGLGTELKVLPLFWQHQILTKTSQMAVNALYFLKIVTAVESSKRLIRKQLHSLFLLCSSNLLF